MTKEQFRLEVQNSVRTWLDWFKQQNNVSASLLEDALNKYMVTLKEDVVLEFIKAASYESNIEDEKEESNSGE